MNCSTGSWRAVLSDCFFHAHPIARCSDLDLCWLVMRTPMLRCDLIYTLGRIFDQHFAKTAVCMLIEESEYSTGSILVGLWGKAAMHIIFEIG